MSPLRSGIVLMERCRSVDSKVIGGIPQIFVIHFLTSAIENVEIICG